MRIAGFEARRLTGADRQDMLSKIKAFIALAVGIGYECGAVVERCDGWRGIRGLAERSC
jgi:hypothetical protein